MESVLAEARRWRDEYGLCPIPLKWKSKTPAIPWGDWMKRGDLPADAVLRAMFRGQRNLGVIVKHPYLVVDYDKMDAFIPSPDMPKTYTVRTGRGMHVWLNAPDVDPSELQVVGADLLRGRLVTLPPSIHKTGIRYQGNGEEISRVETVWSATPRPPKAGVRVARIISNDSRLSSYVGIEEMLASYGIEMWHGKGRYAKGLCPFHDDHDPSFLLDTKTGHVKCMSPSCPASTWWADVFDFYAMYRGISLRQAIAELRS